MKQLIQDFLDVWDWCIVTFRGPPKRKRLEIRFMSYGEADKLIREGEWTVAWEEEDENKGIGGVWLERLEPEPKFTKQKP